MRTKSIFITTICSLIVYFTVAADVANAATTDPCNFNDGSAAFSYERVIECYESVPFAEADRTNALAFIRAARERSDLREVLQERFGWREKLTALGTQSFANDHDFQLALVNDHKEFFNPHWRYQRPWCYTWIMASYIPFDFGSAVMTPRGGSIPEQIIFIEAAPYLAEKYRTATGIDPNVFVGQRIVSVNGVPALEYFRNFGTDVYRYDQNAGQGLNEVLQNAAYSIRISQTHDVPHDRAVDVFVLESRTGQRQTVEIPWLFVPRSDFGLGQWPLSWINNTEDFNGLCQMTSYAAYLDSLPVGFDVNTDLPVRGASAADDFRREITEKRQMVQRLDQANRGRRVEYFESAPGQRAQQLSVVVPKQDGAVAYQMSDRATIIRLDNFVQDWKDEVIEATNYACENSERLIIDMRNNNGGYVDYISWLTAHLLPERTEKRDLILGGRFLKSDPGRNELVQRMTTWTRDFTTWDCEFGYEAGCFIDPITEQPLTDAEWALGSAIEERGGVNELLTRHVLFREFDPAYSQRDPIACPGKFRGSSLIIYTNGTGVSAGYFFPAMMRPEAMIVTSGGILGEPVVYGVARGGAVWGMNNFEAANEQFLELFYGPATNPLPFMVRDVDSFIEQPGAYQRRSDNLFIDDPARGDLHVNVWNDSRTTDAFVYSRVLSAVQATR